MSSLYNLCENYPDKPTSYIIIMDCKLYLLNKFIKTFTFVIFLPKRIVNDRSDSQCIAVYNCNYCTTKATSSVINFTPL